MKTDGVLLLSGMPPCSRRTVTQAVYATVHLKCDTESKTPHYLRGSERDPGFKRSDLLTDPALTRCYELIAKWNKEIN